MKKISFMFILSLVATIPALAADSSVPDGLLNFDVGCQGQAKQIVVTDAPVYVDAKNKTFTVKSAGTDYNGSKIYVQLNGTFDGNILSFVFGTYDPTYLVANRTDSFSGVAFNGNVTVNGAKNNNGCPIWITISSSDKVAILTIATDISGDASFTGFKGHTWIEYSDFKTKTKTTLGTWGVTGITNSEGLYLNLEQGRNASASRSTYLNATKKDKAFEIFYSYFYKGTDAWGEWDNCTLFATDVWNGVTGEEIDRRYPIGVTDNYPNPTSVYWSVKKINGWIEKCFAKSKDYACASQ